MEPIRRNGLIERLVAILDPGDPPETYAPAKPGRSTAESLRLVGVRDRRSRPRRLPDRLRGRLLDLGV